MGWRRMGVGTFEHEATAAGVIVTYQERVGPGAKRQRVFELIDSGAVQVDGGGVEDLGGVGWVNVARGAGQDEGGS